MIAFTSYEQRFGYNGRAAGPDEIGGWWRFFTSTNPRQGEQGGVQSVTLTEQQFDALGRPSTITATITATYQAPAVPREP